MGDFEQLAARALQLEQAGRVADALAAARAAVQASDRESAEKDVLESWNYLGALFSRAGYDDDALVAYETANKPGLGQYPELAHMVHNNLGQTLARLGRLKEAKAHLEEAVRLGESVNPETLSHARSLDNLGGVELRLGDFAGARDRHQHAYERFVALGGHMDKDTATAIGNLGHVEYSLKHFDKAEAYYLRALATHLHVSGEQANGSLLNAASLCRVYLMTARMDEANTILDLLLALRPTDATARNVAANLANLAKCTHHLHRLDLSERLLARAEQLLTETEGALAHPTLDVRFLRVVTWRALGRLAEADEALTLLFDTYQKHHPASAEFVRVAVERAKILRDRGALQLARALLTQVVDRLREQGDVENRRELASVLGNLAFVVYKEGFAGARDKDAAWAEARQLYTAAMDALPNETALDRPWLEHGLAMIEYHVGNYAEAERRYTAAKQRWSEIHGPEHPFVATCAAGLALVHWSCSQHDAALTAFEETARIRDRLFRLQIMLGTEAERLAYAESELSNLAMVVSFCLAAKSAATDAFAAQLTLGRKTRVLDSLATTRAQVRLATAPEAGGWLAELRQVHSEMAELQSLLLGGGVQPSSRAADLRQQQRRLETELSHVTPPSAGLSKVTLDDVRAGMPPGAALVEYVRYRRFSPERDGAPPWREQRYAAFTMFADAAPRWFDLGEAATIDTAVDALRNTVVNVRARTDELSRVSEAAFAHLIEPMLGVLDQASHWIIAADGLVNLVPFDVLLDTWRGLAQAPYTSYVVSGRDLKKQPQTKRRAGVAVFAVSDFDAETAGPESGDLERPEPKTAEDQAHMPSPPILETSQQGDLRGGQLFKPLRGPLEEADKLKQLFPDARVELGATKVALTSLRDAPQILHIATHGIFQPLDPPRITYFPEVLELFDQHYLVNRPLSTRQDPMFNSGLALAGANGPHGWECVITARELADLDLDGTELVVLSACLTGLGHLRDGGEFSGLRRALGLAGSRSQLTSLWAVLDDATTAFMEAFYQQLKEGATRVVAIRAAQLAVKNSPEYPHWQHPEAWAAFTLSGATAAIDFG